MTSQIRSRIEYMYGDFIPQSTLETEVFRPPGQIFESISMDSSGGTAPNPRGGTTPTDFLDWNR